MVIIYFISPRITFNFLQSNQFSRQGSYFFFFQNLFRNFAYSWQPVIDEAVGIYNVGHCESAVSVRPSRCVSREITKIGGKYK
jgi:hypothetical protein